MNIYNKEKQRRLGKGLDHFSKKEERRFQLKQVICQLNTNIELLPLCQGSKEEKGDKTPKGTAKMNIWKPSQIQQRQHTQCNQVGPGEGWVYTNLTPIFVG